MTRRAGLAGLLVALGVLLSSCGIPLSHSAEPVSARNLPPELNGLTSTPTTTTTTPARPPQHAAHLEIYLVAPDGQHLVAVRRYWQTHVTPLVALELLAQGPNSVDSKRGIQTDLGAAPHFEVKVVHKVAQVTLDVSTFGDLFGSNLYVPLAQIVFTLMEDFPALTGVNFYLAGELFNYTPSGTASHAPVTERTYAVLAPQPSQSKPSS